MENQNDNFSKITIESYNGTEPFLFVSYSHRDSVEVSRILEYIDKEKFRMWYDDTMEIGEDFREELRSKIEASCGILLFIQTITTLYFTITKMEDRRITEIKLVVERHSEEDSENKEDNQTDNN